MGKKPCPVKTLSTINTVRTRPGSKYYQLEKKNQLMLCTEITAVCSQIHTEHINKVCGQNVELLNVRLVVHIVTTGL
jgi:hypothetical protein